MTDLPRLKDQQSQQSEIIYVVDFIEPKDAIGVLAPERMPN